MRAREIVVVLALISVDGTRTQRLKFTHVSCPLDDGVKRSSCFPAPILYDIKMGLISVEGINEIEMMIFFSRVT